jgi:hypothetical protein
MRFVTPSCASRWHARSMGRAWARGPFPEAQRVGTLPRSRTLALAKLAVDSLVDGALHEGVSARVIEAEEYATALAQVIQRVQAMAAARSAEVA